MPSARVLIVAVSEYDHQDSAGRNLRLVPAPLPHQLEEVSSAFRAFFQPVPLLGRVTEQELADALRAGAAGFWFIGHADQTGIALTDGILSPARLARYLGRGGVQWSYLNSCDSGALVATIQAVHPHAVFANIVTAVGDAEAAHNGVLFAQGIFDTGDWVMAWRWVASGGPTILRYFPSPTFQGPNGAPVNRDPDFKNSDNAHLWAELRRVADKQVDVLVRLNDLPKKVDLLEQKADRFKTWLLVEVGALVIVVAALLYLIRLH